MYGKVKDANTGKIKNCVIAFDDCPVWVLVELLAYGDFIRFYNFYYGNNVPVSVNLLQLVRSLRNGTEHNTCILSNLRRNTSQPPAELKIAVQQIANISKSQRQKSLSSRPMLEFVSLIYVYDRVVSNNVKRAGVQELRHLVFVRGDVKTASYFLCEMIKSRIVVKYRCGLFF